MKILFLSLILNKAKEIRCSLFWKLHETDKKHTIRFTSWERKIKATDKKHTIRFTSWERKEDQGNGQIAHNKIYIMGKEGRSRQRTNSTQ